jgi:ABC-2 type transport system permease protein
MKIARILAVTSKELHQLARDRPTLGMIVGIPVIQMLMFGYAINSDVRDLEGIVLDQAQTSRSRELIAEIQATQVVRIERTAASENELREAMRSGEASIGVVIPTDFERRVLDGDRPVAQLLVDGGEPGNENIANGIASLPVGHRSGVYTSRTRTIEVRVESNPERRTAVQVVPALIGVILNMTMVIFTAGAIVRERERGNLELLITTPLSSGELMIGKLLPYVLIGLVQTTLIALIGRFLFDVPINGRIFDLYVGAGLFIAATLTLGLVISTLARTQFQAFQLAFMTMLPSILLSGFAFPFQGMPAVAQGIAQLLPLTHFVQIVRGIVLRGASLPEMYPDVLKLCAFLAVMLAIAMARFRKRLD